MRKLAILALMLGACLCSVQVLADDNCGDGYTTSNFNRNDLVTLKKKVGVMITALGSFPMLYAKDSENWNLPTYACQGKGGFQPVDVEYSMSLTTNAQQNKLAAEYQKKIMAAEASGNMQAMMQITQQMQQAALKQSSSTASDTPISIDIRTNQIDGGTIDPGAVLRDGKGFIALRQSGDISSGTESVTIYFDKQVLKDAHEAAGFGENAVVVPGRLDLIHARINISGPKAQVETLVKQLNAGAVLGQLSEKRTKLQD